LEKILRGVPDRSTGEIIVAVMMGISFVKYKEKDFKKLTEDQQYDICLTLFDLGRS
jgi:hypothetical protein